MKRAEYNSRASAVRPILQTRRPANPQNTDKKAGSANKLRGSIKTSQEISTNNEAEIQ